MNKNEFKAYHSKLDTLTTRQRQQVLDTLQKSSPAQQDMPAGVKARERQLDQERTCVHCHSKGSVKNGKAAGLVRFRCRAPECKRTYTALTGTTFSGLHHKDKWETYQACLRERLTLKESAARCGISYKTAFKWRHRFIAAHDRPEPLEGIVEMDETYFLESEKGSRSLRQRRRPRKRGGNVGRRGLGLEQRPVITAAARGGETYACELETAQAVRIGPRMAAWTAPDSIVVSDGHRSYRAATDQLHRRHEVVNASRDRRVRDKVWHLNTVSNRHQTMKNWLNHRHRGVSTKYLDNYMNWFRLQEFRPDKRTIPEFMSIIAME